MQSHPVLYSFRRCPYVIRARMALEYASVTCELREIILRDKPKEMLSISKKGTVPVLQLIDGKVIDESLDVMLWALQQADHDNWLNSYNGLNINKQDTKTLIGKNDNQFKHYLDRYKYFQRYSQKPQLYYRERAEEFLVLLEINLKEHNGTGLVSNHISLADVAIFPFIRQFAHVDWEWFTNSQYKFLVSWLLKFEGSELFLRVMKNHAPWKENSDMVLTQ